MDAQSEAPDGAELAITARTLGGENPACVVALSGELDIASSGALREALRGLFADGHHTIVLDLANVPFCDSTGLGVIASHAKLLLDNGGALLLAGLQPDVEAVVRIAGFDRHLPITATADDAVGQLGASIVTPTH